MTTLFSLEFREPLLLLTALLAIPVFLLARRAPGRVVYSSFRVLPGHTGSWRTRLAWRLLAYKIWVSPVTWMC